MRHRTSRHCMLNNCNDSLCCFDCEDRGECSSRCIRKSSEDCMRMIYDSERISTSIPRRIQGSAEH